MFVHGFVLIEQYSLLRQSAWVVRVIGVSHLPERVQAWSFPILFIAAIAISFVVYRAALKLVLKKVEMEKYFDPILGGKGR